MKLYNDEPNFSISLPGECNATCSFCFWRKSECHEHYLDRLKFAITALDPKFFKQVSITGGEPTLSGFFDPVVNEACQSFDKVVISTNGTGLGKKMPVIDWASRATPDTADWEGNKEIVASRGACFASEKEYNRVNCEPLVKFGGGNCHHGPGSC